MNNAPAYVKDIALAASRIRKRTRLVPGSADYEDLLQELRIHLWLIEGKFDSTKSAWGCYASICLDREIKDWVMLNRKKGFTKVRDHYNAIQKYGRPKDLHVAELPIHIHGRAEPDGANVEFAKHILDKLFTGLSLKNVEIYKKIEFDGKSQIELAEEYGVSRQRINNIRIDIRQKLRNRIKKLSEAEKELINY